MQDQSSRVTMPSPTLQIPSSVARFIGLHGIAAWVGAAADLAIRVFPCVQSLGARLQSDPDTDEERVIIDVTIDSDMDGALAAKKAYTREWVQLCPPESRDRIRLLYHLA